MRCNVLIRRRMNEVVALLAAATASACVPHFRHLEHVDDVERALAKQSTREGVRAELGVPGLADTPALYVYDWEKAKVFLVGTTNLTAVGHTGTRALLVFDEGGHVARTEFQGAGQGDPGDTGWEAGDLPQASAAAPPSEDCGGSGAWGASFAGPEPRLVLRRGRGIRVCDAEGRNVLLAVAGDYRVLVLSPDARLAATWNRDMSLTLRDGSTFQPVRELEPPSKAASSVNRWGAAIAFSADGTRVAAQLGDHGVSVYDTATGQAVLRLANRYNPNLSPNGAILVSNAETGFFLTDVATGRDVAVRPASRYPWGLTDSTYVKSRLTARLGASAFSPDGTRFAVATCGHAEVWELDTMVSSAWTRGLEDAFLLPFSNAFGVCAATVRFSADGRTLAAANEKTVTLYDLVDHEVRGAYGLPAVALETSFTPDLDRAASVTSRGVLTWEVGKTALPGDPVK